VASLDPALSEEITALLKRVASEGKRTLIVSLHRVELALEHFPRVVALKKGAISFNSFSRDVNKQVLESLYAKDTNGAGQEKHGSDFRRELGCSR
jgi:phosphonate transport system ATP-binding protein